MSKENKLKIAIENPELVSANELIELNDNIKKLIESVRKKDVTVNDVNVDLISLKELQKTIDKLRKDFKQGLSSISYIKGEKGEKGDKPTKEELLALIKPLIPEPIKGKDGKDADMDAIIEAVTDEILPLIPENVNSEEVADTVAELLPKYGERIRDALELLPKGERLLTSAIEDKEGKGLDEILEELRKKDSTKTQTNYAGGTRHFYQLLDTPNTYKGYGGQSLRVNTSEDGIEFYIPTDANDAVKVSSNDTTSGYLNGKLVEGDNIVFTENNDGADETLTVAVDKDPAFDSITVDTNTLFVDKTNNRVGIGTTSPEVKLHVSGGNILLDNNQQIKFKDNTGTARTTFQLTSNNLLRINAGGTGSEIAIETNSGFERVRITNAGDVGIGTTSPEEKLHIESGNILLDNTNIIKWKDSAGAAQNVLRVDSGDKVTLRSAKSGGTAFEVENNAGSALVTVLDSGNLGVGSTAPSRKLHVYDTDGANAGAGYFHQNLTDQDTTNPVGVYSYATNNASAANSRTAYGVLAYGRANPDTGITLSLSHTGVYGQAANIGAGTATSLMGVRGVVKNSGGGTVTKGYALHADCDGAETCYGLYVTAGGAVTTDWGFYVTGEDKNYISGLLGINNTAPGAKLHITSNSDNAIKFNSSTAYVVHKLGGGTEYDINHSVDSGEARVDIRSVPEDGVSDSMLRFGLNVTTTGKILFRLYEASSTTIQTQLSSSGGDSYINGVGGNLGIGTKTPKQKLHVKGNMILQGGTADIGVPDGQVLQIGEWDTTWTTFTTRAIFGTSNLKLYTLGLILPNDKYIAWQDNTDITRNILRYNASNEFLIRQPIAKPIYILTNNTERMTIAGTGEVGIGTTTPTHLLEVSGGVGLQRTITAKTADYTVTTADSNTVFTNEGATAAITLTLPTAAVGLTYDIYVQTAQTVTVQADASDTIRDGGSVSSAGGTIYSATQGDIIRLVAINDTEWVVSFKQGTWTLT